MFASFGLLIAITFVAGKSQSTVFTLLRGVLVLIFMVATLWRWISGVRRFIATKDDRKLGMPKWKLYLLLVVVGGPILFAILTEVSDYSSRRMIVYAEGMKAAEDSPQVRGSLGSDLRVGWPIGLNAEVSDQTGHAEMDVPLRGSVSQGTLHIQGVKTGGVWTIQTLYALAKGSDTRIEIPH